MGTKPAKSGNTRQRETKEVLAELVGRLREKLNPKVASVSPSEEQRLRKGKKKTIVAVAHTMLIIAYYLAKRQCPYQELGGDYFDRLNADTMQRRLEKLGV